MLTDPFTGESFEPKRSNQIFANEQNRINYNNSKAKKLRNELNRINHKLLKNFKIMNELTLEHPILNVSKLDLQKCGFDFRFMTHFSEQNGNHVPTIYYFTIEVVENNKYRITKLDI